MSPSPAALHFPPVEELLEWPALFLEGLLKVNKPVLLTWLAVAIVLWLFWRAGKRASMVPRGIQNAIEASVDFVQNDIILQTIGPQGLGWTPFLITMFFFILVMNLFEVIPGIQFPVTARMALPAFMAIVVLFIFCAVGFKAHGVFGYLKSVLVPPGVPTALKPLVGFIELFSVFLIRPFSLAVRLFANMLAGHLLLVTFAVLTAALFTKSVMLVLLPLPFAMLVLVWGFEILVGVLQAFIFTILTAVYIGGALNPEH